VGIAVVSALWGFAEATLFFLVPDMWLTALTVWRGLRPAVGAAGWVVAGAVAAGALMYGWGAADPDRAVAAIEALSAISTTIISESRAGLVEQGLWQLFVGSVTGTPYKIYAAVAPAAGIGLVSFLLATVPARVFRFGLAIAVAGAADRLLARRLSRRARMLILAAFWALFYAAYFTFMPD
jgi:hypothetical protein